MVFLMTHDIIDWLLGMWRVAAELRRIRRSRVVNRNVNDADGLGRLVLVLSVA